MSSYICLCGETLINGASQTDALMELKNICIKALTLDNLDEIRRIFLQAYTEIGFSDDILSAAVSDDLNHLLKSRSLERAKHYVRILISDMQNAGFNSKDDFNVKLWKGYSEIKTDSLWLLERRRSDSGQKAWYWGNFVPQIPRQMMLRYTKPGSWVLDPFCGSGTTLIEAARMKRHALGIEINSEIYSKVRESLGNSHENLDVHIVNADSINADFKSIMAEYNIDSFDLVMLHPPYWDIIKFSDSPSDLSNAETLQDFLEMFTKVAKKSVDVVKAGGYISLVIGDAYRKGEIIPLGFMCMDIISKMGMKTKGIIVKDMQNNRGKRNSENLWRYRALKSGFYIFKHEYVFVFMKPSK